MKNESFSYLLVLYLSAEINSINLVNNVASSNTLDLVSFYNSYNFILSIQLEKLYILSNLNCEAIVFF